MSSRLRWTLMAMLSLLFVINFVDREVLSVLAPLLRDELHFSNTDYSLMIVSFLLGMAIFQLPIGALIDRIGTRAGIAWIFCWWSIVSALHAGARSLGQFCGLRFGLGAGECGNYSGGLKFIAENFPLRERTLAAGLFNSCTFVGTVIAPPLVVWLTVHFSWRMAFLIPSSVSLLWLIPWLLLFPRGLSKRRADVTTGSTNGAPSHSVRYLLSLRQMWGVIVIRALSGPLSHFYWFWLPEYLKRARHISLEMVGAVVWIPFFCGGCGNMFGGWLSSMLLRRHSLAFARRVPFFIGAAMAIVSNLLVFGAPSLSAALVILSVALLGANMMEPCFMSLITDIFPDRSTGRVTGITGIADNSMSLALMLTTGIVLDHFSYFPVFIAAAVLPALQVASVVFLIGNMKKID